LDASGRSADEEPAAPTAEAAGDEAVSGRKTQRWKCVCAYDGSGFEGWQSQAGGRAIQDVIEARLGQVLETSLRVHASGRTDAGVHALGQVFHFDAGWRHGAEKLRKALRSGLPEGIQIKSLRPARPDFHARFSAVGKIYVYHLFLGEPDPFLRRQVWAIERPLDFEAMTRAAAVLRGRHDFRAFSALNGPPKENTVRDLRRFTLMRRGRHVRIEAEADGFMYKMVRSLVGTVVGAGEGRVTEAEITELLETGRRTTKVQTAPPQGLFLARVLYR
jgi:tRNA pseudouridine38-40 synthase